MFNIEFSRMLLAAAAAIVVSATSVAAAVGPARLVETTPVVYASATASSGDAAHA